MDATKENNPFLSIELQKGKDLGLYQSTRSSNQMYSILFELRSVLGLILFILLWTMFVVQRLIWSP